MQIGNFIKMKSLVSWGLTHGLRVALIIIATLLINRFLNIFIKGFIEGRVKKNVSEEKRKAQLQTLIGIFSGTSQFLIWGISILMILPEFGVDITPILTGLGLTGFAVGMAAKDVISDFIAGVFIILEGQYYVGEEVKISGINGEVKEITLRRTVVQDKEGFLHLIPNSQIKIVSKKVYQG